VCWPLELADTILVPFGPDMPAIKNLYSFLRVANLLHYQEERIIPVLMRSDSVEPGYIADIEAFLSTICAGVWSAMASVQLRLPPMGNRSCLAPLMLLSVRIFALSPCFLAGDACPRTTIIRRPAAPACRRPALLALVGPPSVCSRHGHKSADATAG